MTCAYVYTHAYTCINIYTIAYTGTIHMKQPHTHTRAHTHIVISLSVQTKEKKTKEKKKKCADWYQTAAAPAVKINQMNIAFQGTDIFF